MLTEIWFESSSVQFFIYSPAYSAAQRLIMKKEFRVKGATNMYILYINKQQKKQGSLYHLDTN